MVEQTYDTRLLTISENNIITWSTFCVLITCWNIILTKMNTRVLWRKTMSWFSMFVRFTIMPITCTLASTRKTSTCVITRKYATASSESVLKIAISDTFLSPLRVFMSSGDSIGIMALWITPRSSPYAIPTTYNTQIWTYPLWCSPIWTSPPCFPFMVSGWIFFASF